MRSWGLRHVVAADLAFAALLCALDVALSLGAVRHSPHGTTWTVLYAAAGYLALGWRRRAPVAVFAVLVAHSLFAWVVTTGYVPSLGVWVALYTVAHRESRRTALLALAGSFGPAVENIVIEAASRPAHDRLNVVVVVVVAEALINTGLFGVGRWAGWTVRQRRLVAERAAADAAAAERGRIARELHDVVAHAVTLMLLQAGGAARLVRIDPSRAEKALQQVDQLGQEAIVELRRMLALLRLDSEAMGGQPSSPHGLDMVSDLVERARSDDISVQLDVVGTPRPLPPGVDVSAYRIVQEALTNATRYASSDQPVQVSVRWHPTDVELWVVSRSRTRSRVTSNGSGFGILGMRERVQALGGELDVGPHDDGTFHVRATLPTSAGLS